MMRRLLAFAAICLSLAAGVYAHRLDEYLQATIISLEKDHIHVSLRLVPGVAVSSAVIAAIDTNGDGVLSETEQRAYAERVAADLALAVDGNYLAPRLVSVRFPEIEQMKEGLGEIQIELTADLPSGGPNKKLIFQNHHQEKIAAYLVNCLVPADTDIRIVAQYRNELQSFYELDYVQPRAPSLALPVKWWTSIRARIGSVGFASVFRLGMRHIAEGPDHILFLLALLLPAPLLALGARWAGFAGVRQSVLRILKVVTAFTVGHSLTLALAALSVVHVPSRPIEVLIAVSILVSAIHALQPIFPGREAAIAGFFGLIHGLAFATTLGQLGFGRWERVGNILAFNLGIETMQLLVVAATMPSLVLLSRTRGYFSVRIGGALFAGFASLGWIAERLLNVHSFVDVIVDGVAHRAIWIAGVLFLSSVVVCLLPNVLNPRANTTDRQDALVPARDSASDRYPALN